MKNSEPLGIREAEAKRVLTETRGKYPDEKVGIYFGEPKSSAVLTHLVLSGLLGIPWKVLIPETGLEFEEEILFRKKLENEWNLNAIVLRTERGIEIRNSLKTDKDCCHELKTLPVKNIAEANLLQALVLPTITNENFLRDQVSYFESSFAIIQPVLNFYPVDIWLYIKKYGLPYCDLYRRGYRLIRCEPCSPRFGTGKSLESTKEDEEISKRLRALGYL